MFDHPQLPDAPDSSPNMLRRLKLPLGIACGVAVGIAGASLFLRGGQTATPNAPTPSAPTERTVAAGESASTPRAEQDTPVVPQITLPKTRSDFFDKETSRSSQNTGGPNRQDGGVNEAPQAEYKLPPAIQRLVDNQAAEEEERRQRDERIHRVRVAAGADAPNAEDRKEQERMEALRTILAKLARAKAEEKYAEFAELSKSLIPDETSIKALLDQSAPAEVRQRLVEACGQVRADYDDNLKLIGSLSRYPWPAPTKIVRQTVSDYPDSELLGDWKSLLKKDTALYAAGFDEPGLYRPFAWDGERWVNAGPFTMVLYSLKHENPPQKR